VLDGDTAQARQLAVDLDLERGVVERLLEADIAEEGIALQLGGDFFRVLADLIIIRAHDPDRDRLRGPEAHDLAHDVTRLESEGALVRLLLGLRLGQAPRLQRFGQPGTHPLGEDLAEPLAERV
jgi:hypothetical protein